MKKSFTLIEVLIATILVLISSIAILSTISNTKQLTEIIKKNKSFYLKASIIVNESKKNRTNLYEYLDDFKIDNDSIIKHLKKTNFKYKITNSKNSFFSNYQKSTIKMDIYNKHHSLLVYKLEIK